MANVINPVTTKQTIMVNTTEGSKVSTKNINIAKLNTGITADKFAALAAAVSPLLAHSVVSVSKTDVGALVTD